MKTRQLGNLSVSALGLGCLGMSEFYGTPNTADALATLSRAIELGVTFFDTADVYGVGSNEELLSKAIAGKRDKIIVATKFGNVRAADGTFLGINGRPEYVRQACEASLQRLSVDWIDLYYLHRVDQSTPIEDTVGAMSDLVRSGKIRYLGLSEASAQTVRRAHAVYPITALQSEYSLWSRDPEGEILATTRELGIGFVPYSPLGRGFLAGRIRAADDLAAGDYRRNMPRFQKGNIDLNTGLVDAISTMAEEKNCTIAQLALAWVLAQGEDVVPIPGTKRRTYLEENVLALEIDLTAEDLARLDRAFPKDVAAGLRQPPAQMAVVNR